MKIVKFALYIYLAVSGGYYARAAEPADSVRSIKSIMTDIAKERADPSAERFNIGKTSYQVFSQKEADVLHLLGTLSSFDGICIIVHNIYWKAYNTVSVDSILRWYDRKEYLLEEDSLKTWLIWQSEFFDYWTSPHYTSYMAAMFQNWNDSIPDNRLKDAFLNKDGTLKSFVFDEWQTYPPKLQELWQELVKLLPGSEFIKIKLKLDFLQSRYDNLWRKIE